MGAGSIRGRLTAWVLVAVAAALAALAVALFVGVSRAVREQNDRQLLGRARALAALIEHDEDGYEMELVGVESPALQRGRPFYFQAWLPGGEVLARSQSLAGDDLPAEAGSLDDPLLADVELPDGRAGRRIGVGFVPRSEGDAPAGLVTLVVAEGTEEVDATLRDVRLWFLALGGLALLAVGLVTAAVVRRGLRPLVDLGADLDRIDEHRLDTRLPVDGQPAELVAPVDTLNRLLARLEASFARERRFTADASHELRTPLAGLRTLLEVTALKERSGDDYRAAVAEAHAIAVQLAGLVDDLLTLARLDAGQVALAVRPVRLRDLVDECWRPQARRAAGRALELRNRIDDGAVIESDPDKLRLIIGNLLANAVDYTQAGGWIEVAGGGDGVVVDVTDSGPPIPDEHLPRIFDRFFRADPVRSSAGGHCGIGLSLARALAARLGLTITANNLPGGAVRFRVSAT